MTLHGHRIFSSSSLEKSIGNFELLIARSDSVHPVHWPQQFGNTSSHFKPYRLVLGRDSDWDLQVLLTWVRVFMLHRGE